MADFSYPTGVAKKLPLALLVFFSALLYNQIQPPPPKVPGSPGGPPITANRTKLRDGRHLAYLESGVPKDQAKYKIIFVHGFFCCRYDVLNVSQGLLQELGIYLLSFDRPGYCESDAHPARTEESIAVDIAELADNLQLGPRFHLMGFSMGGEIMWSCLKHIPHRLAGVAILAPKQVTQQGEHESLHRDMIVGFGKWGWSPLQPGNPFAGVGDDVKVHLWHGVEDLFVPVALSRYISKRLPWVIYHELPTAGHLFPVADGMPDVIVKSLLLGDG
uniref:AB hydrolase-1 domain-containing protein n=1 Tax=Aegilops tauschii TaxID=37682 RepID=M8CBJ3_AEGTA